MAAHGEFGSGRRGWSPRHEHGRGRPHGAEAASAVVAGQVDAQLFLAVSARLKAAFAELAESRLPAPQRGRWQSRLLSITETAKEDLVSAAAQLDRYEDDIRHEMAARPRGARGRRVPLAAPLRS